MTPEEAIKKLKKLQESEDPECAHSAADGVLCKLLVSLGYKNVVKEYDEVEKWYA
jgi:hypothetical protein